MNIPNIQTYDSYAIAIAWHSYISSLGFSALLERWGKKWRVIADPSATGSRQSQSDDQNRPE